jgi:formyltetrahydrofolate deformylase
MKNTAILLISCPDRKGIVASVADFLYKHNANILHADEHQDSENDMFFLRIEWDMNDFKLGKKEFGEKFGQVAKKFKMNWKTVYSREKPNVAIFLSREDHCLADLLYRYKVKELDCNIKLVISNHSIGEQISKFYNIPFHKISDENGSKESEKLILKHLKKNKIGLVILARYMKILSEEFINAFGNPIINIHHSFLPSFVGANPYHRAYEKGVKIIGATAHYVTKDLDQGPIIEQDVLRITHRNSVDDMVQKGRDIEKIVLARAVRWHLQSRILTYANKTVVFD